MTREEAINTVRNIYQTDKEKEALEILIPELAESEDERVIRALETFLNQQEIADKITFEARIGWLTWLEKQKENHKSVGSIPTDCVSDVKYEDRWHKVEDSLPDNGREVLAKDNMGNLLLARYDGEGWDVSVYDDEDYRCHNGVSKWCEIPPEKQKDLNNMIVVSPEVWDNAISDAYENGKKEGEKQKEQKPLTAEETELNSIAFLEQMGYTCIPPRKEQKPAEPRKRNKPKESWLSKTKYEIEHADELLIQRQEELREIRELKKQEQKPENKLEDAFKYYTDRGISISCGDIKAEPKKEQKHRKFKLGDKVHWYDDDTCVMTITGFRDDAYITDSAYGPILFCNEDDWKKVEQKSVELSDDELQKHQDELYDFKVFAAKQAKEYHISFVHDYEWNNFCAELLSYFNEKQKPFNICEQCPYYKDCPNYNEQKLVDNISKEEYVKRFKALCDAYEIKLPNREYDIYHLCDDLSKLSIDSDKQSLAEGDNETEIQKVFREGKSAGRKEVFDHPEEYGLQKEQKVIHDIASGDAVESCMLRYLQSAANRKDDTEIIEDTKTYKSELISIIKKEQKPVDYDEELKKCKENPLYFFDKYVKIKMKEQKPAEKQDYSGLNDLERAIHRGFLSTGVENVPVTIIKETAKECLAQMKPAEWSEEDEEMRNLIVAIFEVNHPDGFFKANELGTTDMHGVRTEEIISWLKSLTLNLKKKNEDISKLCSNEWSEEDEGELQNAIDALEFLGKKGVYKSESGYDAALQAAFWLKSLPLNLKKKNEDVAKLCCNEWSKEDEKMYKMLSSMIHGTFVIETQETQDKLLSWLKSIPLRCPKSSDNWKPNEDEERLINISISFLKDFADKGYENAVECIDWLKSKLNGNSCK